MLSKFDLYKTARLKKNTLDHLQSLTHDGFVKVLGHLNEVLISIELKDGRKEYVHKTHLERFCL